MIFREAVITDIPQLMKVRYSVTENVLSDPSLVTEADCAEYITKRGKGGVCVVEDKIVGFAIADITGNNIWALFVQPGFDGSGIGRKLHDMMMGWYFKQTDKTVWLGTSPGTRAERFYITAGWKRKGVRSDGEILFEMARDDWKNKTIKHL